MEAKDTVMKVAFLSNGVSEWFDNLSEYDKRNITYQAEISFRAGIKHTLSRAVGEGCLSTVNGKHGIHIPDKLYEELSNETKS